MSHRSPSFREPSILNANIGFFLVSLIRVLSFGFKKDYTFTPFTQIVDTGWTSKMDYNLRSDILSLTGMAKAIGNFETPEYVLSMSYEQGKTWHFGNGDLGLATLDDEGNWVKAVAMNFGGTIDFVIGPWNSSYGLGTYGLDPRTKNGLGRHQLQWRFRRCRRNRPETRPPKTDIPKFWATRLIRGVMAIFNDSRKQMEGCPIGNSNGPPSFRSEGQLITSAKTDG